MSNFIPSDRKTDYLLPPSVDDWLTEDHLVRLPATARSTTLRTPLMTPLGHQIRPGANHAMQAQFFEFCGDITLHG